MRTFEKKKEVKKIPVKKLINTNDTRMLIEKFDMEAKK
jgi:hypothetical protein